MVTNYNTMIHILVFYLNFNDVFGLTQSLQCQDDNRPIMCNFHFFSSTRFKQASVIFINNKNRIKKVNLQFVKVILEDYYTNMRIVFLIVLLKSLTQKSEASGSIVDVWINAARWGGNLFPDMQKLFTEDQMFSIDVTGESGETALQVASSR